MAAEFEASATVHSSPAGLEYVGAVYEQLGAEADSAANWADEALYDYSQLAHGEAFWAYEKLREDHFRRTGSLLQG